MIRERKVRRDGEQEKGWKLRGREEAGLTKVVDVMVEQASVHEELVEILLGDHRVRGTVKDEMGVEDWNILALEYAEEVVERLEGVQEKARRVVRVGYELGVSVGAMAMRVDLVGKQVEATLRELVELSEGQWKVYAAGYAAGSTRKVVGEMRGRDG